MWKSIFNYPNYEISTNGEVRNIQTLKSLKYRNNPNGYAIVLIRNNHTRTWVDVNILMRTHFTIEEIIGP